jgi:predicted  nucleic acid-binding Zn-ribbon protein
MHVVVREAWTDERLDKLENRMDEGFREVRAEIRSIRGDMGELRGEIGQVREELGELRAEIKGLEKKFDAKFDAMNRTLQIGFGLIGSVLVGILGLTAAQL